METLLFIFGSALGLGIGYIVHLNKKSKFISKREFDDLNIKYNQVTTSVILAEEKYKTCQELLQSGQIEILNKTKDVTDLQTHLSAAKENLAESRAAEGLSQQRIQEYQKEFEEKKAEIKSLNEMVSSHASEISRLSNVNESLKEKLETHKGEIIELQKNAQLTFEKIASEILDEKTAKFTETNKNNIEVLLKPLGDNIEKFKKQVEETYDKEAKERFSLGEKVKDLIEQTNKVSNEANNLATALKGQSKKQGNWGEIVLESILERSGLIKNREYFVQPTIQNEEGKNLRPDILINLPDKRVIIIDSKVSLIAYDKFYATENSEEQALHIADHLKSVRNHIDDLNNKKYDDLDAALDFTMMFIPIEPAYLLAIQSDNELWSYAYSKRILLISPTNLIACLKLIADLWKREMQSKNALEIVKRGELLFEKFVSFSETLEDIGKHLNNAQNSYGRAFKQLTEGRGNLVNQAQQLKNLGLKSSKNIPANLVLQDDLEVNSVQQSDEIMNTTPENL